MSGMNELKIQQLYRIENSFVCIDVNVQFYREVFNDWDFSPLLNRDMDDDLFEYLEGCSREIPRKYKAKIILHLPEKVRDFRKEEINTVSFRNFFNYKIRKQKIARRTLYWSAVRSAVFGLVFISTGYLSGKYLSSSGILAVLREGFYIGGWVLFWELFTTLFFTRQEIRESIIVLTRLKNTPIEYRYS